LQPVTKDVPTHKTGPWCFSSNSASTETSWVNEAARPGDGLLVRWSVADRGKPNLDATTAPGFAAKSSHDCQSRPVESTSVAVNLATVWTNVNIDLLHSA
jgi:hypothetical protein